MRGRSRVRSMPKTTASRGRKASLSTAFSHATTTRAPWASNSVRSSWAGAIGLCSTAIAPSSIVANTASTWAGQFGMTSATRSPGRTPAASNAEAARRTRSTSSRYVVAWEKKSRATRWG